MADRQQELETLRDELIARFDRYRAHKERRNGPLDKDTEDQASEIVNDEVIEALQQEAEDELRQVLHAIKRIEAGEGDACEQCGGPIGDGRLQALPHSTLCLRCAERQ